MGLRGRLRKLQAKAEEDYIMLVADDGEEMRAPEDTGMRVLVAHWKMERGEDPEDVLAERLIEEEQVRGWREKDPVDDGTFFTLSAQLRESKRRQEAEATDGP